uniref:Uncharacterized protein n=1 Tax=Oryza brachyantha TaxID=4533 RepID=J3N3G5_ORYBR
RRRRLRFSLLFSIPSVAFSRDATRRHAVFAVSYAAMAGRSSGMSMVAAHRLFAAPQAPQHGADAAVELDEAEVIW